MAVTTISPVSDQHDRPLLSVVIPTYQCRRFAGEAVRSVITQLESNSDFSWELFVVDDASPEGDPLVGSEFHGRVRVIRQPKNLGHAGNLSSGIAMAKGHLIHVLHGDDFVFEGFYSSIIKAFQDFPSAFAVFTQSVVVNETGQWTGVSGLLATQSGLIDDLLERLAVSNVLQTPSIVVKREAYERLGAFNSEFSWTEDWEMWARIAAKFPVAYVDKALCAYRQHGSSSSSRHFRDGLTGIDSRRCLEAIWQYLPEQTRSRAKRDAGKLHAQRCLQNIRYAGSIAAAVRQARSAIEFCPSPSVIVSAIARLCRFCVKAH